MVEGLLAPFPDVIDAIRRYDVWRLVAQFVVDSDLWWKSGVCGTNGNRERHWVKLASSGC